MPAHKLDWEFFSWNMKIFQDSFFQEVGHFVSHFTNVVWNEKRKNTPSSLLPQLSEEETHHGKYKKKTATHTLEPFKQKAPDGNLKVGFQWWSWQKST